MNKIIVAAISLMCGILFVRVDDTIPENVLIPHPYSLTLEGEVKVGGKSFLIAGSNATATVKLTDFVPSHAWKEFQRTEKWADMTVEYKGKFRH